MKGKKLTQGEENRLDKLAVYAYIEGDMDEVQRLMLMGADMTRLDKKYLNGKSLDEWHLYGRGGLYSMTGMREDKKETKIIRKAVTGEMQWDEFCHYLLWGLMVSFPIWLVWICVIIYRFFTTPIHKFDFDLTPIVLSCMSLFSPFILAAWENSPITKIGYAEMLNRDNNIDYFETKEYVYEGEKYIYKYQYYKTTEPGFISKLSCIAFGVFVYLLLDRCF